jgi:CxxC motif-containing protein (DUF1111 family)
VKLRTLAVALLFSAIPAFSQTDPGPRGGAAGAGGPLSSVAADSPSTILSFFNDAQTRFTKVDAVADGLGPRFNSRSCASCHAQPTTGGSSPATNPEVADATANGATNTVPSFITSTGPVREARFIFLADSSGNPTSTPSGMVEELYTIVGRTDHGTCTSADISQPNFAAAASHNNIIYRIPTPVFGGGLIEGIDESDLLANLASRTGNPYGTSGTFNHNGHDGTITRFGWKAQNKSLLIFAGEAYNVEMGVSNEMFTQERPLPEEDHAPGTGLSANCRLNLMPEDHTNFGATAVGTPSDVVQFAMFMRLLAPAKQASNTGQSLISVINGEALFGDVGCTSCHNTHFTTGPSDITSSLDHAEVRLWSDLAIHHMGTGLADNVVQGDAGADQFRTAPLWGVGQRLFFLHDGRKTNLLDAITAHSSTGSEANTVIANFNALSVSDKQDILNFLRSL